MNDLAAKSYVRTSRREFFKYSGMMTAKGVVTLLLAGSGFTATLNASLTFLSRNLPLKKKDGLAILISYNTPYLWDKIIKPPAKLFIPAYVSRIELAFGQKANIVKRGATREDFFAAIKDDSIQNIVLYGHGSWDSWLATDSALTSSRLYRQSKSPEFKGIRKEGLLVRHTCGVDRFTEVNLFKFDSEIFNTIRTQLTDFSNRCFITNIPVNIRFNFYAIIDKKMVLVGNEENYEKVYDFSLMQIHFEIYDPNNIELMMHKTKVNISASNKSIEQLNLHNKKLFRFLEVLQKDDSALSEFNRLINSVNEFFKKYQVGKTKLENKLLGIPFFSKNQIKGWDRISYPWEFMINVFGQNEQKLDNLYAMAKKEK